MWSGRVGLCAVALLCLHSSVFGQGAVEPQGDGVFIFCDDPTVEKAAIGAVHKFNKGVMAGHKLALYQILGASKSENGSGSVYTLQFNSRRSDCPVSSDKPWTDCDYLPSGPKEPFFCNATVLMTETDTDVKQVDCLLHKHIVPERAHCLGCPEDIDENAEELKVALSVSISKFNLMANTKHLFKLHSVGHATRQVVAGLRYRVSFDMRKTNCSKAEHEQLHDLCTPDADNVELTNCNSTVDVAPWRLEPPVAQLKCEAGPLPPRPFSRRRPAGWTPLRYLPTPSPSDAAPAKEESSEEDTTGSKPSAAPDGAVDSEMDHPFHCPSKPWRAFPPSPSAEASPTPTAEGTFSDKDLLA